MRRKGSVMASKRAAAPLKRRRTAFREMDLGRIGLVGLVLMVVVMAAALNIGKLRELVSKGATGFTVGFTTDDCRKTYETLLAKGVEFTQEPVERFYGTDVGLRDPFGNAIRITELAANPQMPTAATMGS